VTLSASLADEGIGYGPEATAHEGILSGGAAAASYLGFVCGHLAIAPTNNCDLQITPMATSYHIGQRIRARATFKDKLNLDAPVSPDLVCFQVEEPNGTESVFAVAETSTGVFDLFVTLTSAGIWVIRAYGQIAGQWVAATETSRTVRVSSFVSPLATS
jgi:hypothetical protein